MESIRDRVARFCFDQIIPADDLSPIDDNTNFRDSGFFDSISTMKLVSFLEKEFGIELGMADVENGLSIAVIVAMITNRSTVSGS